MFFPLEDHTKDAQRWCLFCKYGEVIEGDEARSNEVVVDLMNKIVDKLNTHSLGVACDQGAQVFRETIRPYLDDPDITCEAVHVRRHLLHHTSDVFAHRFRSISHRETMGLAIEALLPHLADKDGHPDIPQISSMCKFIKQYQEIPST